MKLCAKCERPLAGHICRDCMQYHRCRDVNCESCKKVVSEMVPYALDYSAGFTAMGKKLHERPHRVFKSLAMRKVVAQNRRGDIHYNEELSMARLLEAEKGRVIT